MVRMGIEVEGLKPYLSKISELPKTAQDEIRTASQAIADDEAQRIRAAALADDAQSRAVAAFVRSRRDRVPAIAAGGNKKTGVRGGATAGELFFGAEFGGQSKKRFERQVTETKYTTKSGKERTKRVFSKATYAGEKNTTAQFRPHKGRVGYWFWPQLRKDTDRMHQRWEQAVDGVAREWERG